MPGAVGDVVDQDPEAWRDAVETSAYVADNSALRKREREFLPLSPPSWKDFARFETRVVEGIGQEWEKTLSTNISAMFYVVKAAVAHMPECSSIINTASVNADTPVPIFWLTLLQKARFRTSRAGSLSFGRESVRANAVAPGPVWTPLIPSTMPVEAVTHFGEQVPMKRPAQPSELAWSHRKRRATSLARPLP
jgi:NAD(P)-dependent dehydrogenase (short-subunit alcohol dehydrogenase family)